MSESRRCEADGASVIGERAKEKISAGLDLCIGDCEVRGVAMDDEDYVSKA